MTDLLLKICSELARVQVTTWDGVTRRVVVPLVFDVEELLSALSGKIQKCAACPTCKLQRTSMEIWTVDERGIGKYKSLRSFVLSFYQSCID